MDVLAATDARAAEVHAVKEFAQTDSGLSSPVNPKEAVGNEEAGNGMKINNKSNEEVTVPATIAMWQEEAISGNSSLIDRVMEAESRATSPTPAEDEGEADEPTVWVADENAEEEGIDEIATAVETFEDTKEKDGATAASKAGRAAIPTTIAMWDDEKRPDSPPRVSADERFARLKVGQPPPPPFILECIFILLFFFFFSSSPLPSLFMLLCYWRSRHVRRDSAQVWN